MANWIFTLPDGAQLRKIVSNGTNLEVIKQLQAIVPKLVQDVRLSEFWRGEFSELNNLLDGDDLLVSGSECPSDYGVADWQELVNDRLSQFYDLCDSAKVWVAT